MKARIVVTPEGKIQVFIDEGTFEEGRKKIEQVFKGLQINGITLDDIGPIEQHRHEDGTVHTHSNEMGHNH